MRPLDEDLSDTILDAALHVLRHDGYGGFSIAAVAQEAGVHRPAIYRRWPGKADLAVAAIKHVKPAPLDRNSGDVRTDLLAYLVNAACGADDLQALALRLHQDLAAHDDLASAVDEQIVRPSRDVLGGILRRGIAAGQLRADVDVDLTIDLLTGTLHAARDRSTPVTPAVIERYVDLALGGLQAAPRRRHPTRARGARSRAR